MKRPNFENLLLDVKDGVGTLTFHRPKALNALNEATLRELRTALTYVDACASSRHGPERIDVLVLTGSGEKAFIAGADILEMKDKNTEQGHEFARLGQGLTRAIELLPQPVIAAVNGFALGGGCEFALACDFILASENAVFGQPEVCLGIMTGFGGSYRLPKFIGLPAAREWLYTGRRVKAPEAKALGLVNEVVPLSELLPRAHAIAQEICKNSPLAVARTKKLINQIVHASFDEGMAQEALQFGSLFGGYDQREGMNAFAEKRAPQFKGE